MACCSRCSVRVPPSPLLLAWRGSIAPVRQQRTPATQATRLSFRWPTRRVASLVSMPEDLSDLSLDLASLPEVQTTAFKALQAQQPLQAAPRQGHRVTLVRSADRDEAF